MESTANLDIRVTDTTPLFKAGVSMLVCPACAARLSPRASYCSHCGYFLSVESDTRRSGDDGEPGLAAVPKINGKSVIRNKYRLTRYLGTWCGVKTYAGLLEESGQSEAIVLRTAPHNPEKSTSKVPSGETTVVSRKKLDMPTVRVEMGGSLASADTQKQGSLTSGDGKQWRGYQKLELEYEILSQCDSPVLPKPHEFFQEDDLAILVMPAPAGTPLFKAWHNPQIGLAVKLSWLEQLRSTLAQMHRHYVVFPALQPSRLVVDDQQQLRIRDLQGIASLPVDSVEDVLCTYYTAPELMIDPQAAGLRSDGYTFGGILYALHLGQEISEIDFESAGTPRPFALRKPDAHPALVRLISKTFSRRVEMRFPPPAKPDFDPSGFDEIGKALAEYTRDVTSVRYDIAGWSSTGLVRFNNEDCFTFSHISAGAGEYRRDIALVCIADGMGGHSSGEVASAIAVSAVADYLRQHGLSSAITQHLGKDHPFHDVNRCSQLLREATFEANRRVCEAASENPSYAGMGCTLEVVLFVGRKAIACHIGDSRIYHRADKKLHQITKDQTVANRLVELGQLKLEEIAGNPHRSELCQAIGSKLDIQPGQYDFELNDGDWVVACTDGVSEHVTDVEIDAVLSSSDCADTATRRLINLANLDGGSDNSTLVVVHVR